MFDRCPIKYDRTGFYCMGTDCVLCDNDGECLIAKALKKYLNPISSIIEPNPNFTPPTTRIRSDIH